MKEQIIQLPDNFEVREIKDGKIILAEKEKKLIEKEKFTYEDIAKELFENKNTFYIDEYGDIESISALDFIYIYNCNNCTSRKQAEKLLAINKLMNVAKYLNGDWQPNWCNTTSIKYFIRLKSNNEIDIDCVTTIRSGNIYFKSRELTEQAIEILGEETIRLALCTDY